MLLALLGLGACGRPAERAVLVRSQLRTAADGPPPFEVGCYVFTVFSGGQQRWNVPRSLRGEPGQAGLSGVLAAGSGYVPPADAGGADATIQVAPSIDTWSVFTYAGQGDVTVLVSAYAEACGSGLPPSTRGEDDLHRFVVADFATFSVNHSDTTPVTLTLRRECAGVLCPTGQLCGSGGRCVVVPGLSVDAGSGMDASASDGAGRDGSLGDAAAEVLDVLDAADTRAPCSPDAAVPEQCNGLDDDCDGVVDNGCPAGALLVDPQATDILPMTSTASPFERACPSGSAVAGLYGGAGCTLGSLGPLCARLSLREDRSTVPYSYSIQWGSIPSTLPLVPAGATSNFTQRCNADEFVTALAGTAGMLVNAVQFTCSRLRVVGGPGAFSVVAEPGFVSQFFGDTTACPASAGSLPCPAPRLLLTSLQGRAGTLIEALGGTCSRPSLVLR